MRTPSTRIARVNRIARSVATLAIASLVVLRTAAAQSPGPTELKENLDLPFNAAGEGEDEEDAPEVVVFFGRALEGDAFFYVIDRSASMRRDGRLEHAKGEVIRNVREFSERVRFGIIFFDVGLQKFPDAVEAADASPAMKSRAIGFVGSVAPGGGTCGQAALTAALKMARATSVSRKVIVYLSDGGGTCPGCGSEAEYLQQTLEAVAAQNHERVRIDTIGIGTLRELQEEFLMNLAAENGGAYSRIQ
ncbi:MAG: VWA domain-containing protein [Planctomycetes bacterium]|nr:VWA domain-containing protein [Planctomycetota bacterium]